VTDARLARLPLAGWQAACLRHAPVAFLSALYLYVVGLVAIRQPLWFDEILTYYVSNLGGPKTIVSALLAKAENHPPLDYLARHLSMSLFGGSELAFRLPSIIAMLVAALCLYVIVLRRTSVLQALVAFSLPFTTFALRYAHEGRPYAFLFASMCLAFLAWQLVTEKPTLPRLALLTICLSLGPYSHYYGVLNYVAIGVGEAWRWWEQRKIAWPVVASFAVSVAIDGLLAPFVLHSRDFAAHFWTTVGAGEAAFIYIKLLSDALPAIVMALIGSAVVIFFMRSEPDPRVDTSSIPRYEIAAALTICLVPVMTYVLAALVTHAFYDKYVITTVVGIALVAAYLSWHLQAWRRGCALVIALTFGLWMAGVLGYKARYVKPHPYSVPAVERSVIETATQPVVIFDGTEFMRVQFYLPPNLRDKVYLLTDPKLGMLYKGNNTDALVYQRLKPFVHLNVANLCAFTRQYRQFLVMMIKPYAAQRPTWVVPYLVQHKADVRLIGGDLNDFALLSVTVKGASGC